MEGISTGMAGPFLSIRELANSYSLLPSSVLFYSAIFPHFLTLRNLFQSKSFALNHQRTHSNFFLDHFMFVVSALFDINQYSFRQPANGFICI